MAKKKRSLHTEGKANVLCQQNKPVFSDVDFNQYIDVNYYTNKTFRLQELPKSSHSPKEAIHITTPGIVNQSQKINPSRATGPDNRQCRIEGADLVGQIIEYDGQIKQKVIQIYDHIKKFIKSKEFIGTDVEDEIKTEFGDILDNIEKQKEKVMVDECPIVIAGETSAGKSSFINLLLGKDILPSQLLSCTTTICRLRNSDTVGIAVTDEDDKKINIDVNYVDDKDFRLQLKKYVSRTSDQENYKYVDISLPLPLLKSHTLIIDTPGIGTSPELNNRLLDFLPNAMAFIYIINSSNAGGLQGDRLLKVFESQNDRVKRTRMQEFDTKTTIFVCNKWEQVPEEEEEDVMNFICSVLKDSWPNLNVEGQIYKLSVKKIKRSIIEQASEKCASISKELYTYLNKKETTDRMFKFSVHEYPTGRYQWFIKEKAKDLILEKLGKMENWSNSWNQLSLEDKNDYKEKAKEINSEPSEPLNHSKQLLKKICSLIKELADTGVEACLMGVDLNQNMIEMGTPKMCSFIKDNPEIVQKVYLHITNGIYITNKRSYYNKK
ncbi:unnamed protein product [Mytilus edulis]|uniref:Dynamin N-terminal domain-containing protein n=1 Tax=Mytilus edulis TaxID=6550 RepID=A0A8S3RWT5_MYTED|nr:unnamed protein product [Mytilus edulis]